MGELSNKLKAQGITGEQRKGPLWLGPEDSSDLGGITFSALSRFLTCRERFRLRMIEGLRPVQRFDHKIEFGQLWHTCEEAAAKGWEKEPKTQTLGQWVWDDPLREYVVYLRKKYPMERWEIDHWYNIVRIQFPLYVQHWSKHPDVQRRETLLQEQVFKVPYTLSSGRTVYLRGKWDSVDLVKNGNHQEVWLQENKTKGRVEDQHIERQLTMDLQTMMYMASMEKAKGCGDNLPNWTRNYQYPIAGVRYNVVKRPGHHQGKKETKQDFHERLHGLIAKEPGEFFMRWNVPVLSEDIKRFKHRILSPLLEQLCDWYKWVKNNPDPFNNTNGIHWQHPFGVYNVLDEGGCTDLDQYLTDGSMVGLERSDTLFSELQ